MKERVQNGAEKRGILALLILALLFCFCACSGTGSDGGEAPTPPTSETETPAEPETETPPAQAEGDPSAEAARTVYAAVGDETLEILLEENASAEAFYARLSQGDLTVSMQDYGGFEKVGPLGESLPTEDRSITTEPGDVILYQGNSITIYYGVNTWSFTKLGAVQGRSPEELKSILGAGDITAVFSLHA